MVSSSQLLGAGIRLDNHTTATAAKSRPTVISGAALCLQSLLSEQDHRTTAPETDNEQLQNFDFDRGDAEVGQPYRIGRCPGEVDVEAVCVGAPVINDELD